LFYNIKKVNGLKKISNKDFDLYHRVEIVDVNKVNNTIKNCADVNVFTQRLIDGIDGKNC